MALLAAVFADAIDLEGVARGEVVVSASDLLLELADFLRKEFDGAAAFGADHVVMAAAVVLMLVAGNAVVEGDLTGESALGEKISSAGAICAGWIAHLPTMPRERARRASCR